MTPESEILIRSLRFKVKSLDKISLGFVFLIFIIFTLNLEKFQPFGPDAWYHLAISKNILEKGGIPLWNTWDFQPFGRPHLYPPLYHLLIALFASNPENVVFGARVLQATLYPLALLTAWYFARLLFDERIAFLSLLLLSIDVAYLIIFIALLPSSFVNLLFPLILLTFLSKRFKSTLLLIVLTLYTHLSLPILILLSLLLISLAYRNYFRFFLKLSLLSFILYIPWFFRLILFRDWMRSFISFGFEGLIIGFLLIWILNPLLLFFWVKGLRLKEKPKNCTVLKMVLLAFIPLFIFYGGRYFWHVSPFLSIYAAIYIEKYFKVFTKKKIVFLLLLLIVPFPSFSLNLTKSKSPELIPSITALDGCGFLLMYEPEPNFDDEELSKFLLSNTSPEDIIHVDEGFLGDKIYVLTGRRTDNGMWFEVSKNEVTKAIDDLRRNCKDCIFVYLDREKLPKVDEIFKIGIYWIGIRKG